MVSTQLINSYVLTNKKSLDKSHKRVNNSHIYFEHNRNLISRNKLQLQHLQGASRPTNVIIDIRFEVYFVNVN